MNEFLDETPPYAILSHTWEDGEVSFQEFQDINTASIKPGFVKIQGTCTQALNDKLEWCWVDTCCIDKSSSAELSEAINSMFEWYRNAKVCYVFLADFPDSVDGTTVNENMTVEDIAEILGGCKWFTRGWTLQELLAPLEESFFTSEWRCFGTRDRLAHALSRASGIDYAYLKGTGSIWKASLARRLSWMSARTTTRLEDLAYAMLGIFEVNMPLLYGEGSRAFIRLQEEIIRRSDDQSIFCWEWDPKFVPSDWSSLLAPSPGAFTKCGNFRPRIPHRLRSYSITNIGLSLSSWVTVIQGPNLVFATLDVTCDNTPPSEMLCIPLAGGLLKWRLPFPALPFPLPFPLRRTVFGAPTGPMPLHIAHFPSRNTTPRPRISGKWKTDWDFGIIFATRPGDGSSKLALAHSTPNARYLSEQGVLACAFSPSQEDNLFAFAIMLAFGTIEGIMLWVGVRRRFSEHGVPRYQCYCGILPITKDFEKDFIKIKNEEEAQTSKGDESQPYAQYGATVVTFGTQFAYSAESSQEARILWIEIPNTIEAGKIQAKL